MNRAVGNRVWSGLLAAVVVLAVWLGASWFAAAQTLVPADQLVAADPMPNARLAMTPEQIALTFPVPVASESARIRLLGVGGIAIPVAPAQVAPNRSDLVQAVIPGPLESGDYSVVWSARAADGGRLFAGAYPFRAGVLALPGAAESPGQWPAPCATLLRWLVFLGTAVAGGGFAWGRLLAARTSHRSPARRLRLSAMGVAALAALLATISAPVLALFVNGGGVPGAVTTALRVMPPGWQLQFAALVALVLICLTAMVRSNATLDWLGVGAGLAVLVGLGLTSHAASAADMPSLMLEMVHLWSTALWFSGLLFFLAGWRGLGSDVARFRTVRWVGGVLLAVSVMTGVARATSLFPSLGDLITSRYGQVLAGKTGVVLVIIALGGVAMLTPGRANALQASRFLGTQALCAGLAALLAALLALMTSPGIVTSPTLAGVSLSAVVTLDRAAFGTDNGTIHLLTQPATPGPQTLVVRLTSASGTPLAAGRPPAVEVQWTGLHEGDTIAEPVALQADPSGVLFTGAAPLAPGWWQADVVLTPPGGVTSRARFWLVVPDPNVSGDGPGAFSDPEATALFERGLASLTALRSVRIHQSLADGAGAFVRSRVSVSAAEGEQPATFAETVLGADGTVTAAQTIVGNRRWVLDDGAWVAADPVPFQVPAGWGEMYAGATGFQLGPREAIDGELSQIVIFQVPPQGNPAREPAWHAWWVGLASGQVRREVTISMRHYMVTDYRDFNASIGIEPPVVAPPPVATPTRTAATPEATPTVADNVNP